MNMPLPPSPADFEAALRRIEAGAATVADAGLIRNYVGEIEDTLAYYQGEANDLRSKLKAEQDAHHRFQQVLSEAFNSGKGVYRP
jgi:hypothetical protein